MATMMTIMMMEPTTRRFSTCSRPWVIFQVIWFFIFLFLGFKSARVAETYLVLNGLFGLVHRVDVIFGKILHRCSRTNKIEARFSGFYSYSFLTVTRLL